MCGVRGGRGRSYLAVLMMTPRSSWSPLCRGSCDTICSAARRRTLKVPIKFTCTTWESTGSEGRPGVAVLGQLQVLRQPAHLGKQVQVMSAFLPDNLGGRGDPGTLNDSVQSAILGDSRLDGGLDLRKQASRVRKLSAVPASSPRTSSALVMSAGANAAWDPSSLATASPLLLGRSTMTAAPPCCTMRLAAAWPRPEAAPVMRATRPERDIAADGEDRGGRKTRL